MALCRSDVNVALTVAGIIGSFFHHFSTIQAARHSPANHTLVSIHTRCAHQGALTDEGRRITATQSFGVHACIDPTKHPMLQVLVQPGGCVRSVHYAACRDVRALVIVS